jgi:hypothetical protein
LIFPTKDSAPQRSGKPRVSLPRPNRNSSCLAAASTKA